MATRRYMGMCCGVTTPLQQYRRSKQLHQGDYDVKSLIAYDFPSQAEQEGPRPGNHSLGHDHQRISNGA